MEISEFLTRIDLKGADSTIFKKEKKEITFLKNGTEEKKEVDGISTFTKTDNGSSAVSGFLIYNKKFPKKVFSMQPSILKKILSETDDIDITDKMNIDGKEVDGTFLVGLSKEGNIYEDIEPSQWWTLKIPYDEKPVKLTQEIIAKILRRKEIIDPNKVVISSDGKIMTVKLFSKIGSSNTEIKFPCDIKIDAEPEPTTFMAILDKVGDKDVEMYIDRDKKKPLKFEIKDDNFVIEYYNAETYNPQEKENNEEVNEEVESNVEDNGIEL